MGSSKATKIKRVLFGNVSGFLLYNSTSAVLIDTGHSKTTGKFQQVMRELDLAPDSLKLIVLTHTHFDHAGGARAIKDYTGARILVHEDEAVNLKKGWTPVPRGTRWKGKVMSFAGRYLAPWIAFYPSVEPDILIKEEFDLSEFGIPAMILHTPGHTSGSLSILLEGYHAFMGDNTFGISKNKHFPPFANDQEGVWTAWEKILRTGAQKIYPAHGSSFDAAILREELKARRR